MIDNHNIFNIQISIYLMVNTKHTKDFMKIPGIGKTIAKKLIDNKIETIEILSELTVEQLMDIGINKSTARKIIGNAKTIASMKTVDTTRENVKSAAVTPSPKEIAEAEIPLDRSQQIIASRIKSIDDMTEKDKKYMEQLNLPIEEYIELTEEEVAKRLHFIDKLVIQEDEGFDNPQQLMEEIDLGTFTPSQLRERLSLEEKFRKDLDKQAVDKRNSTIQSLFTEDTINGEAMPEDLIKLKSENKTKADTMTDEILDRSILIKRKSRKRSNSRVSNIVNSMLNITEDDE